MSTGSFQFVNEPVPGRLLGRFYPLVSAQMTGPTERLQVARVIRAAHFRGANMMHFESSAPLKEARTSLKMRAYLETRLAGEMQGPVGQLIHTPPAGDTGSLPVLTRKLNMMRGQVLPFQHEAIGGSPGLQYPAIDYRPLRLGANPPQPLVQLHRQAMIHVLTACGIPAEFVEAGDGTARREAWRQFIFGAVAPLARSVEAELTAKLETPITLDFSELRASDLAGRSRAYKQLIEAGMTDAQAAIISGFE